MGGLDGAGDAADDSNDGAVFERVYAGGVARVRPGRYGAASHAGEPPEPPAGQPGRGVIENKHSNNIVSPPPPSVCMRGVLPELLRTSTPPTMYSYLLLLL
jgi:hypothetical protein